MIGVPIAIRQSAPNAVWEADEDRVLGHRGQINITTLFNTLPGETKQFLHQDDGLWPIPRPHPSFLCNALIALDDFDVELDESAAAQARAQPQAVAQAQPPPRLPGRTRSGFATQP